jgi:hypothetical protein
MCIKKRPNKDLAWDEGSLLSANESSVQRGVTVNEQLLIPGLVDPPSFTRKDAKKRHSRDVHILTTC